MKNSLHGSCLCGAVRYRAATSVRRVVNCHCSLCRKMNGSAFSSYAVIPFEALEISGETHVATYVVTQRARKHYCGRCGTPLFNLNSKYPGACMLYLGTVDGNEEHAPSLNVYCETMLSWLEGVTLIEGLPAGAERGS